MIEILCVVFFMYVWFETSALVDYSRALGLSRYMKIDVWESRRERNPRLSYLNFLSIENKDFFSKLISCKECLCFWLSLIICHFGVGFLWTPAVYLASLLVYNTYVWLIWKLSK